MPVWAYVNGDVPLAGARARIVTPKGTVRQVNGRLSTRTNAQGVVLLAFARVPRQFTVVVTGGRARGRRVRGSQSTTVAGYRAARVVEVNPLTTVLARLRQERPRLTPARAALIVKRHFGIPAWADLAENLRTSHGWFDAGAYLRQAGRYGSSDRLTRVLVWRMLHGFRRLARTGDPVRVRAAEVTARTAGVGSAPAELVRDVFKNLLGTAVEIKKQEFVGGALGGLLQLAKTLGLDLTTKSELDGVREQLNALSAQVTELKGKIADVSKALERINASQLLHQSDDIIAKIRTAQTDLTVLANTSPTDPTHKDYAEDLTRQQNFADDIIRYIGTNLRDAPARLDLQLSPTLAIGDDVFKATSRSLATSNRFFDERDSQEVQAVYQYFATSQTQLAILLANYYNANRIHSVKASQALISQLHDNITKVQTKSLKTPVPAGTFIDTRTPNIMWAMYPQTVTALTLLEQKTQTSRTLSLGAFHNYQLPSSHDLRNLVDGATGDPRAWLQAQVKVHLLHQLLWVSDRFRVFKASQWCQIHITIFDLATVKLEQWGYNNTRPEFTGSCSPTAKVAQVDLNDPRVRDFLRSKYGGVLFLRYLAPGESYYW